MRRYAQNVAGTRHAGDLFLLFQNPLHGAGKNKSLSSPHFHVCRHVSFFLARVIYVEHNINVAAVVSATFIFSGVSVGSQLGLTPKRAIGGAQSGPVGR